jgi:hypothetical protein
MKTIMAAVTLSLACSALPAHAADTVTYRFKALVEYGSGPGSPPMSGAIGTKLGAVGIITVTLDKNAGGTITSDTAIYSGGYACPANPDPIVSITVTLGGQTLPYFTPGSCDVVSITQNVNGVSSIIIYNDLEQVGTTFDLTFTSTSPNAVPSLAIPDRIDTTAFDRSLFNLNLTGPDYQVSGDLATK